MMTIPLLLLPTFERARMLKESALRKGLAAMPACITWTRGYEEVATAVAPFSDFGITLGIASAGVCGFSAEACLLAFDSFHSPTPTHPDGQPWGPLGMQSYFEQHGPDSGVVDEALGVLRMARHTDRVVSVLVPYTTSGSTVKWGEPLDAIGSDVGGTVVECLREAFEGPTGIEAVLAECDPLPDGEEINQQEADEMTITALAMNGARFMVHGR